MGVRNGQINCEGDGFLTFLVYNFASTCNCLTRRSHDAELFMSKIIMLERCESACWLSSNVHARVDVSADRAKVLLDMNLLYFVYFCCYTVSARSYLFFVPLLNIFSLVWGKQKCVGSIY